MGLAGAFLSAISLSQAHSYPGCTDLKSDESRKTPVVDFTRHGRTQFAVAATGPKPFSRR